MTILFLFTRLFKRVELGIDSWDNPGSWRWPSKGTDLARDIVNDIIDTISKA